MLQFTILTLAFVAPSNTITPNSFLRQFEDTLQTTFNNGAIYLPGHTLEPFVFYEDPKVSNKDSFDFIIVGSGSSGSVLANRLSEEPNWKILLLEVGEQASSLVDVPIIAPSFQFTNYDWSYKMEEQENVCLGCPDGRMHWPRGRALGGSTIINFMINVRGNFRDYQRWEDLGNPGWGWKDVLPYFKKIEDSNLKIQDEGYHQRGGNLPISDVPFRSKIAETYVKASQEYGLKYVDYNGRNQIGISFVQSTTKNGKRFSAEKSYLRPAFNRPNLKILTKAHVTKILIDEKNMKAYGVRYSKNKKYFDVYCTKEIILSAGTFNSPQLLMLSGVGPQEHLNQLGIKVLIDLPVGKKMYDHITFVGLNFEINETKAVLRHEQLENTENYLQLILNGKGPLTSLGGVEAIGYIKTNVSNDDTEYPDVELIIAGTSFNSDKGLVYKKNMSISQEIYDTIWKPLEEKPVFTVLPMLLHPKSVGYLKLKSKNPYHRPLLYGNYFTDSGGRDIKTFIAAIREIQKINNSPALKKLSSKLVPFALPGCSRHRYDLDEFWECALRHNAPTLHHQVATCKMGPSNDSEAVVDSKLRVYGVSNLRIADSSIIPIPLSAHTSTPAYMIGEKASDIIKKEWKDRDNILKKSDIRRHIKYY